MGQDLKNKQTTPRPQPTKAADPVIILVSVGDFAHSVGVSANHRFVVEKKYAGEMKELSQWQTIFNEKHSDFLPKI